LAEPAPTLEDVRAEFGPFGEGRVWLNCAHQGPLPRTAAAAAATAIAEKVMPHRLRDEAFNEVPDRLRALLGQLVGVPADEVILANGASYGLHLLANGLPLEAGDEVLVVDGDFPSTVLPWLLQERERGIAVRFLQPQQVASPDELAEAIGPRTRALCTSWVFSFTGLALDLDAIGGICQEREVVTIVNGSQGVGARSLDLARTPIDALVSVGFKWTCGPYATGFAWVRPDLREALPRRKAYWLAAQRALGLERTRTYELVDGLGAAGHDVFNTASFMTYRPWTASLELLLSVGIDAIAGYDDGLADRLVDDLQTIGYEVRSPLAPPARSTLVLASHPDPARNEGIVAELAERGIALALRDGAIRISPHLYNTPADLDAALDLLEELR
jgi:selenocysteine lyase/cysteine desulfurase